MLLIHFLETAAMTGIILAFYLLIRTAFPDSLPGRISAALVG